MTEGDISMGSESKSDRSSYTIIPQKTNCKSDRSPSLINLKITIQQNAILQNDSEYEKMMGENFIDNKKITLTNKQSISLAYQDL